MATAIVTQFFNSTDLQILGEILNTLNGMPAAPTPWIGLPPFLDTKTDLLYEIWQALKNGGGAVGGGVNTECCNKLEFDTSIQGSQAALLPAYSLIEYIVVTSTAAKNNVTMGTVTSDAELLISSCDFAANEVKSFAPSVFLPTASQLFTTNTNGSGSFHFVIFYKTLTAFPYVPPST